MVTDKTVSFQPRQNDETPHDYLERLLREYQHAIGIIETNPDEMPFLERFRLSDRFDQAVLLEQMSVVRATLQNHPAVPAGSVITADYDGQGDEGHLQSWSLHTAESEDITEEISSTIIVLPTIYHRASSVENTEASLRNAIPDILESLIQSSYPGYENNEGAFGEIAFVIDNGSLNIQHKERIIETEFYETQLDVPLEPTKLDTDTGPEMG